MSDTEVTVLTAKLTAKGSLSGKLSMPAAAGPKLEPLNVKFVEHPLQQQNITPPEGVDGFSSVKAGPAAGISVAGTFMILMAGYDYDSISSLEYISVYDHSGRNSTKFYRQS